MDKFFTVLKENGLIMNFVFFCVCFLIIGAGLGTSDEVKKTPCFLAGCFFLRFVRRGSFCIFNYSRQAQKKQPLPIANFATSFHRADAT